MDRREVDAVREVKKSLAHRQPFPRTPANWKEELDISFDSYIPTSMGCLPGFAGYEISVSGREMRSHTYFDLGSEPVSRGFISPEDEELLRNCVIRWTIDREFVPWEPSPEYCAYDISLRSYPLNTPTTYPLSYRWENSATEVPQSVSDLVTALRTMIRQMPAWHREHQAPMGHLPGPKPRGTSQDSVAEDRPDSETDPVDPRRR